MRRVLIAAAGNVLFGDDGFGPEVLARLRERRLPTGVRAVDFGVRGMHLLLELTGGYDAAIVVDVAQRGEKPGTLYVLAPEDVGHDLSLDVHDLHPARIFALADAMGGAPRLIRVICCEPARISHDELEAGLSPEVAAAIEPAADLALTLAAELAGGSGQGVILHA